MLDLSEGIKGPKFRDGRGASARPAPVDVSILFPCYNEAEHLESTLLHWQAALQEQVPSFELVVINDGSSDGTGRILDRLRKEMPCLRVIHQLNSGPARALRRGLELSRGTYTLFAQANQRLEPEDFLRMWEKRGEALVVSAQRTHRLDPTLHRLMSVILKRVLKWMFNIEMLDPGSPFRLFHTATAVALIEELSNEKNSFPLCLALRIKLDHPDQVIELPVPYRNRPKSTTPRRNRERLYQSSWKTFTDLLTFRAEMGVKRVPKLIPNPA